jgi:hypothetical protein
LQTPGEVFSFMQVNKIGVKLSLFWIAWAFVAEKVGNFSLADKIFQKGIRLSVISTYSFMISARQSEPKELLQNRYQHFQRRFARHLSQISESSEVSVEPERQPLHVRSDNPQTSFPQGKSQSKHKANNFLVYQENEEERKSSAENAILGGHSKWSTVPTDKDQRKENTGEATSATSFITFVRYYSKVDRRVSPIHNYICTAYGKFCQ